VLVGHQLGFNPLSSIKSVARGAYRVASDSRVQQAAAAAAQAYAPEQYATATQYADQARGIIRPPMPGMGPGPQMPMQQQMPAPPQMPQQQMPVPDDDGPTAPGGPVQKGNLLMYAAIGGGLLVVLLMLRK
jgi:hypothetical protein